MYKIIFLIEAIEDIENAGNWYEQKQYGLKKRFTDHILAAIEKIQSDKIIYVPAYRGLSRVIVKRFPYIIYFRKNMVGKQITVFGVLHVRQSKTHLDDRV
jgi:plasmid stabilization system protein ParE